MSKENPYQAPQAAFSEERDEVEPAGKWLRLANYIVDNITFVLFSAIVGLVVGLFFGEAGLAAIESIPNFLFGMIMMLIYFAPLEGLTGRTIGKLLTGTKVVNEEGGKPSFGQILGRTFCRFIPFEAFSFLGATGRGWHDSLPKTYVIKVR